MKISTLFYTLKQGFKSIFRNKWFSLASIATISACLFLFGLFYAIVMNVQHSIRTMEEDVCVTVFFQEDVSDARVAEIGDLLTVRPEVSRVEFVSREEAWEWAQEHILQGHAEGFPTNPLEHFQNYKVYLSDVSMQDALVNYLQSMPEVRTVNYSQMTASTLSGVNLLIAYVSLGIIVILLAVSIFLISNTVTIGISVRQEEINIMKYVGATDFFVRAPFVIEGMLIGAIGALIPLEIINIVNNQALSYVSGVFPYLMQRISFLPVEEVFAVLLPVSIMMGVGIGFFGSFNTVRKHLRV